LDTNASPYKITNAGNLAWFREYVNESADHNTACAKLMNNIDLSTVCHAADEENNVAEVSWTPIAAAGDIYDWNKAHWCGVFDGNNKTISNLYINGGDNKALFAYVATTDGASAEIKDFNMTNVSVTASDNTSAVCASLYETGVISNVEVASGSVYGNNYVGSISSENRGTINNCINRASVTAHSGVVGGICGVSYSEMCNCANYGDVTSNDWSSVGGIASQANASVKNCVNYGKVTHAGTGFNEYPSGIVAKSGSGTIENCANFGDIYVKQDADKSGYIAGGGKLKALKGNLVNTGKIYLVGETTTPAENATMIGSAMEWYNSQENDDTSTKYDITAADAATGKYAYILQSYCTEATWGQDLSDESVNTLPTLGGATVYATKLNCAGTAAENTGYSNSSTDVSTEPHNLTKTNKVDETCTTPGNNDYWTCSVCNNVYSDEGCNNKTTAEAQVRPALGHDYTNKTLAAVAETNGLYAYVCDHNCGEKKADVVVIKDYAPSADNKNLELTVTTSGETTTYATTEAITLTDANQFNNLTGVSFTATNGLTYTRTMNYEWGTLVLPFDCNKTQSSCKFYVCETAINGTLIMKEITDETITAGRAVFVRKLTADNTFTITAPNGNVTVNTTPGTPSAVGSAYKMIGTYSSVNLTAANTNSYFIYNNAFWNVSALSTGAKATIPAFHAYINAVEANNNAKLQIVVVDEATGLHNVQFDNLQGTNGKYLEKGQIVIVRNGKKYNVNGQVLK